MLRRVIIDLDFSLHKIGGQDEYEYETETQQFCLINAFNNWKSKISLNVVVTERSLGLLE